MLGTQKYSLNIVHFFNMTIKTWLSQKTHYVNYMVTYPHLPKSKTQTHDNSNLFYITLGGLSYQYSTVW